MLPPIDEIRQIDKVVAKIGGFAKLRAAIKAMSVTGVMTEADVEAFGTDQISVVLDSVGLEQVLDKDGKHVGVQYNAFYKAVKFSQEHPDLVQLRIDPDNAKQLDEIPHTAADWEYAKANWPQRLTDKIRDLR